MATASRTLEDSAVLPSKRLRAATCATRNTIRGMTLEPVSHDPREEDLTSKVRWFSTLSPEERLRTLLEWSEAMQKLNPGIRDVGRHAAVKGRIQIVERHGDLEPADGSEAR